MSFGSPSRKGFVSTQSDARRCISTAIASVECLEQRRLMAMVAATPAEKFVDSVGVNTHFTIGGTTNPYTKPLAIDLIDSLGVRHIRSGDHTSGAHTKLTDLYDDFGVQTLIVPPPDTANASPSYLGIRMQQPYAEALEGLNEPANWLHTWNGYTSVDTYDHDGDNTTPKRTLGDFTAVRQYNNELYAASKLNAPGKPVLSSAMGNPQMNPYLAGTDFDIQAMHPYAGTGALADFYKYDNFDVPAAALTGGTRKIWNTETGYFTTNSVSGSVTEAAQGKFIPRLLTEFFKKGVERTYLYELVDQGSYNGGAYIGETENARRENSFGLARSNGTPKPAYYAVKNLLSVVDEYQNWNTTTKTFGFNTNLAGSLDYTLAHDPTDTTGPADISDVHQLLLKKSTGEYDLLLWREAGKNDTTGPRKVSLTLNASVSSATLFSDLANESMTQTNWSNRSTFTFDVPDSVVVLRLNKPQASQTPQSLGISDNFEGQTVGQQPSGWASASGDTSWKVVSVDSKKFAQSTATSGDHYLSKTIATNGASFTTDFDYTWQGGGTTSYGDYAETVGYDVMDVSGNGYRVILHQGTSGSSANNNKTVEIYQLDAGTQTTLLGSGAGFNQAGWDTLGYASPNFHRIRVAYDNGTFSIYGDTNFNGTLDLLASGRSTTYTNFTRLKLRSLSSTNTGPAFDNVETNVATVSLTVVDAASTENPGDTGKFRITRNGGNLAAPLTVSYVAYGSAANGTDYTAIPLSVTIPANQTTFDINVTPTLLTNDPVEGDENVVLKLSELPGYHISNAARTAEVLIKDYAPDLIVTNVIMSNARPVEGETITFKVVVQNIGNAPVPLNSGWQAGILFDVQGQNSFLTAAANTSLAVGASTTLDVTGSYTYTARAGNHQITAWVDPELPSWSSTNGRVDESNDRNNAFVSLFRVASSRYVDPGTLSGWTTTGDGWTVKTSGTNSYYENTTTGTGTRSIRHTLSPTADHSWTLDFAHNWRWGGVSGNGQHSLSVSTDVLDANGNGFRVRFYQGNSGISTYNGELVEIYKVTGSTETRIGYGSGFNSPGWLSLNGTSPTWRRSRLMYDVGTRTLTVLADLAGNGTYTAVASAADLAAPRTFTSIAFNAESLQNTVGPELDEIQFDTLY